EFIKTTIHFPRGREQPIENSVVIGIELRWLQSAENRRERRVVSHLAVHLAEACRVPQLVAKSLAAFDPVFLKPDVLSLWRDGNDTETKSVGAVFFDEIKRIGGIAE